MHTFTYSLVCKSALINILNKPSPLRWRIPQLMLDTIKETPIHQFHLGIFFPTLISWSQSPEETVKTSSAHDHVTYAHFLTLHWKVWRLHVLSESRGKISFQVKPGTTAACRNTGNLWITGLLRKCHRGAGLLAHDGEVPVQLGTGHLATRELVLMAGSCQWSCCTQ